MKRRPPIHPRVAESFGIIWLLLNVAQDQKLIDPLPAIGLLPIALLWFGFGKASVIVVLVHPVLWPLALKTFSGFRACPRRCR